MSSKGFFAKRKAAKKKQQKREQWDRIGNNVATVSAGVTTVATVVSGFVTAVGWMTGDKGKSDREISRTDALNALSVSAQNAKAAAINRYQRRQAAEALKATEKALESLALQRSTAEADYARAVYAGVHMHRTIPTPQPIWWPEGVSQ